MNFIHVQARKGDASTRIQVTDTLIGKINVTDHRKIFGPFHLQNKFPKDIFPKLTPAPKLSTLNFLTTKLKAQTLN